ncbi:MAG: glucose-1-phosphate cytidylyltransferase [Candidatus Marinimicrobia bacterium]|nr:glucose-1-phosphate cytidylyltransferase [Candidatus Neomarinimicrobiota bacterium]MCF7828748.1 glucose-1-phosphate cytidylyltransferase [Candidatus Neomarinimicrobiota bacterium]MCF7880665.1 glucose-1-phosphate cytidylyltransferase [Candidatus Neomarinimicrobiota bacterium]
MKTIILAGGWGTRLGQLTDVVPKPMVKIGGKPVLWHIMKIYSHYGFNEFIFALGVKSEVIKDYFYNYETLNNDFTIDMNSKNIEFHNNHDETNWKVTLVDTGLNTLKGGRVKRVEKFLNDDINMLTYGDGVSDVNIDELLQYHKSHGKTITITGVHPPARFGELIESDGEVQVFQEKPQTSTGLINGGFMVFNSKLLNYLTPDEDCDLEHGPMEELAAEGEVMVYKHKGNWECMDHERDVAHLNKLWKQGNAFWKVW